VEKDFRVLNEFMGLVENSLKPIHVCARFPVTSPEVPAAPRQGKQQLLARAGHRLGLPPLFKPGRPETPCCNGNRAMLWSTRRP
jgi:hypothetical protein